MIIDMPYAAACLNREVQNRLASTLTDWVEELNQRLAEQNKSLVTFDRAVTRSIEGSIEISKSLRKVFPADQLDDDNCLQAPMLLNGIQIQFPIAYESTATLSLMFIQSDGAGFDGLAVNPWKQDVEESHEATDNSELVRSLATMFSKLTAPEDDVSRSRRRKRDWIIYQPCFFPRIHHEWLHRLIFALNAFDQSLLVRETGGFLPVFEQHNMTGLDFASEMAVLADQYLKELAEDASA